MKKSLFTIMAVVTITLSATAQARVNENGNLKGERKRVAQGVRNGEITRAESKAIAKQTQDVRQAKRAANADGVITPKEKARLAKQDAQLDRTIRRTKHNNRDRN